MNSKFLRFKMSVLSFIRKSLMVLLLKLALLYVSIFLPEGGKKDFHFYQVYEQGIVLLSLFALSKYAANTYLQYCGKSLPQRPFQSELNHLFDTFCFL